MSGGKSFSKHSPKYQTMHSDELIHYYNDELVAALETDKETESAEMMKEQIWKQRKCTNGKADRKSFG